MDERTTKQVIKRTEELEKFITGKGEKELAKEKYMRVLLELFNPFNRATVTDPFISILLDNGGKDQTALPLGTWIIGGEHVLVVEPEIMPPQGTLDGREWIGVRALRDMLLPPDE